MNIEELAEIEKDYEYVHKNGGICDMSDMCDEIPKLIAEIKNLKDKNVALQSANDKLAEQSKRIIGRNLGYSAENATLKKALKLLSEHYVNSNFMNTSPKSVYDAFIEQAQKQEGKP
jgi:predicted nuclease with TOPRIM domain